MSQHRKNLAESIKSSSNGKVGEYEAMLDEEDREELESFLEWFKVQLGHKPGPDGKPAFVSSASVSSYKSYLSKAWALETEASELTSDQRSAVRKYNEFCIWRENAIAELDETEDELEDELED